MNIKINNFELVQSSFTTLANMTEVDTAEFRNLSNMANRVTIRIVAISSGVVTAEVTGWNRYAPAAAFSFRKSAIIGKDSTLDLVKACLAGC
jgi:hypothetical protein